MSEHDLQTQLSHEEYAEAHTCPMCSADVRERYFHSDEEREACYAAIEELQANPIELLVAELFGVLLEGKSIHSGEFR